MESRPTELHMPGFVSMARAGHKIRWLAIVFLAVAAGVLPLHWGRRLLLYLVLALATAGNLFSQKRIPWESLGWPHPARKIALGSIAADVVLLSLSAFLSGGALSFATTFLILDLVFAASLLPAAHQALVCLFVVACDAFVTSLAAAEAGLPSLEALLHFLQRACLFGLATALGAAIERMRHRERTKQEALLNNSRDGILVLGANKRIAAVNSRAAAMLGSEAASLVGVDVASEEALPDNERLRALVAGLASLCLDDEAKTSVDEVSLPAPDPLDLRVKTVVLGGQRGRPSGWLISCQSQADEKELERLRDKALSHLAHELRAPLTNIKLYADTLQSRVAADDAQTQEEFTAGIIEETNRFAKLIDDLVAKGKGRV